MQKLIFNIKRYSRDILTAVNLFSTKANDLDGDNQKNGDIAAIHKVENWNAPHAKDGIY